MEQRIAIRLTEVRSLEVECPQCHALTGLAIDPPAWTRKNTPLGHHGFSLCVWCGRDWPTSYSRALLQLRDGLAASRKEGSPILRIIA